MIVGVGRPRLDLLGSVLRLPDLGKEADLRQFSIQGGGATATALVALLEWGHTCRLIAKVSDDPFGQLIRSGFDLPGFHGDSILTEPGCISPFAFVALKEGDVMERAVYQTPGNVPPLEIHELPMDRLDGCAALLVDTTEPRAQLAAAEEARERGIPVMLHASHATEALDDLIANSDVLVCSERLTADIAPAGSLEDSLHALADQGPTVVVLTMGQEGCVGIEGDEIRRQPIFPDIAPLERGGASHIFFAGFVHATLEGLSLTQKLRLGTAAAGLSCRHMGTWAGVPSLEEATALAFPKDGS